MFLKSLHALFSSLVCSFKLVKKKNSALNIQSKNNQNNFFQNFCYVESPVVHWIS